MTTGISPHTTDQLKAVCARSMQIMGDGDLRDFEAVVHPGARNREGEAEPPACRGTGPAAFYATALWLREAYADLHWEVHDMVAEGDIVVAHVTMSGRQVGTFVSYGPAALPAQAFPGRGRTFATTQTHGLRVQDGNVIEHWAQRDELGTPAELGWVPPTPLYLARSLFAKRKAMRLAAAAA